MRLCGLRLVLGLLGFVGGVVNRTGERLGVNEAHDCGHAYVLEPLLHVVTPSFLD